jgi:hypothetical protein
MSENWIDLGFLNGHTCPRILIDKKKVDELLGPPPWALALWRKSLLLSDILHELEAKGVELTEDQERRWSEYTLAEQSIPEHYRKEIKDKERSTLRGWRPPKETDKKDDPITDFGIQKPCGCLPDDPCSYHKMFPDRK